MGTEIYKNGIAVILFKVLSIYAFIEALNNFASDFRYFFVNETLENYIVILIQIITPCLLLVIASLILWNMAPSLASFINDNTADEKTGFSAIDVHTIAISTVGLFIIALSFPDIVQAIALQYGIIVYSADDKIIRNVYLLTLIIKIILGLWLLLGSRGIAKFISSTRRG